MDTDANLKTPTQYNEVRETPSSPPNLLISQSPNILHKIPPTQADATSESAQKRRQRVEAMRDRLNKLERKHDERDRRAVWQMAAIGAAAVAAIGILIFAYFSAKA